MKRINKGGFIGWPLLLSLTYWVLLSPFLVAQPTAWQAVPGHIMTRWVKEVRPDNVWKEYPRPQMVRNEWQNLNGLWDYAIRPKAEDTPAAFDGRILVPFAAESALSGVKKRVGARNRLWYHRTFSLPTKWTGQRIMLHFGAADWEAVVFINGKAVGKHQGGYDPFYFDITDQLLPGEKQELTVSVWDPTSEGTQPRGKQVIKPESIWYTPVTGIWQTVWLEPVPTASIQSFRNIPNIDDKTLTVTVQGLGTQANDVVKITALDGAKEIASASKPIGQALVLKIPQPNLWSPDAPFLYDLKLTLIRNGKTADEVKSYFGMRKISLGKDADGMTRILLNNRFVFQYGILDQGWWPDGLYTAPTDAAMRYDIEIAKQLGFNMIRKHVKTEPARWYTYCDRMGLLVWQDMPSGDQDAPWQLPSGKDGTEITRSAESEAQYRKEWQAIMDTHQHFPSLVMWVPFNEAWGQFKTQEIISWTMQHDTTRLVDGPSGGNHFPVGHTIDHHEYPGPAMEAAQAGRALVTGEFGGLNLLLKGHFWTERKDGYQPVQSGDSLLQVYGKLVNKIAALRKKGLSAAVYTQTTDLEDEESGLMTYDRAIMKMDANGIRKINGLLVPPSRTTKKAIPVSGE